MGWSAALVADLLFGSRLQGALHAAGVELVLCADPQRLAEAVGERGRPEALIVDLSDPAVDTAAALAALGDRATGVAATHTVGFYSHVHPEQRARGEAAGLELVVPRSRIAREAPALLASLRAG